MKPSCDEVRERLFELLETSCDESPDLAVLRRHYEGCAECQAEARSLTHLLGLTRAALLAPVELPVPTEPAEEAAIHRERLRRRLGLIPPSADLQRRLQALEASERLELLRQATQRVLELFRLPDWDEFEGLWRVGLATTRRDVAAGNVVTPKPSFQNAGELVEYALLLERKAEQGVALTNLEMGDLDSVGAALLREILAGSSE